MSRSHARNLITPQSPRLFFEPGHLFKCFSFAEQVGLCPSDGDCELGVRLTQFTVMRECPRYKRRSFSFHAIAVDFATYTYEIVNHGKSCTTTRENYCQPARMEPLEKALVTREHYLVEGLCQTIPEMNDFGAF